MKKTVIAIVSLLFYCSVNAVPFIVQTLSSRYGLILGGFGPGYEELRQVEVVKHDTTCPNVISDVPLKSGRFLGDVSGMAEYVDGSVIYCRHSSCWKLDVARNKWSKVGGFLTERDRAASAAVGDIMVILGGRDVDGLDIIGFEMYDSSKNSWVAKPEWEMAQGRYSFCAVPVNSTALLVVGGYSRLGALASVELLDIVTGRWETLEDLPKPRYGHSCLHMELAGAEGILVSGGALTGSDVQFLDLGTKKWRTLPPLLYRTDGHKMVLIEGIPTVFSWEHIEQFDGKEWRLADMRLSQSRSAFAVTTVPGHLIPQCVSPPLDDEK